MTQEREGVHLWETFPFGSTTARAPAGIHVPHFGINEEGTGSGNQGQPWAALGLRLIRAFTSVISNSKQT